MATKVPEIGGDAGSGRLRAPPAAAKGFRLPEIALDAKRPPRGFLGGLAL